MRLLTSKHREIGLTDLGLNEENMKRLKAGFTKPYGMILSTGPTGSGKTTSMYSILKILNTKERNIATIEDPVEYDIEGMNQIQVNPQTNLTFADGLRSILRQDPDIIYVGEIRDNETADIAVHSAMTGHLVLSTLHTNDAATSIPRFIDMGIEPFLVSSTISVIVAQRLVRKVCEACKVSITVQTAEIGQYFPKETVQKAFGKAKSLRLYKGKGCGVCNNTGYIGRIGIFEVLTISPAIQELIHKRADADTITKQAVKEGMQTMLDDGLQKVVQGVTTIEEVLRVIKN
jgi:type II secretory ATPase GspE/PulE/Tfp pilus assembly ATPase PilB-like protein